MQTNTEATWSDADAAAANAEGWDIFDSYGSDSGPWQIQRFDDPTAIGWPADLPYPFEEDTDVWEHVWHLAHQGGHPVHERALAYLKAHNPMEYEAIERWVSAAAESDA